MHKHHDRPSAAASVKAAIIANTCSRHFLPMVWAWADRLLQQGGCAADWCAAGRMVSRGLEITHSTPGCGQAKLCEARHESRASAKKLAGEHAQPDG